MSRTEKEDPIRWISGMPKVELHVHIEGATEPATFYDLAGRNGCDLGCRGLSEWEAYFSFRDFSHFIDVYTKAVSTIQKPEDLAFLVERFYATRAQEHIVHTEAYLSATFLVERFRNEEILDAVESGMRAGAERHPCSVKLIPDIARHVPESQDAVLQLALDGHKRGLFCGLGLGGLENGWPPELFEDSYARARAEGLRLVAHAGEAAGADSVRGATGLLRAERIGHGVRCLEDPELVRDLALAATPLEVCPTSNYCLGIVEKDAPHPIREMVDRGLFCTLSSDDPAMFSTNLNQEYALLHAQGFSMSELCGLNHNAIHSAFLPEAEKESLRQQLDHYCNEPGSD